MLLILWGTNEDEFFFPHLVINCLYRLLEIHRMWTIWLQFWGFSIQWFWCSIYWCISRLWTSSSLCLFLFILVTNTWTLIIVRGKGFTQRVLTDLRMLKGRNLSLLHMWPEANTKDLGFILVEWINLLMKIFSLGKEPPYWSV